ncbi:MAG: hypothetical protein ACO4AI_06215 [Prochlorothrix sp.]
MLRNRAVAIDRLVTANSQPIVLLWPDSLHWVLASLVSSPWFLALGF